MIDELFIYHGFGDFVQIDAFLRPEERQAIQRIHWASKNRKNLEPILKTLPEWRHVQHVIYMDTEEHHFLHFDETPWELLRCNLSKWFVLNQYRQPAGSTFLDHTLADIHHFGLPDRFDFVVPNTPYNPAERATYRNMADSEWEPLIERLETRKTMGVVCNSLGGSPVPTHPRLLDLTGKSSIIESVEILKRATGYIGIDSWAASLASQLFDHDDLLIRSQNPVVVATPWVYFPGQTRFHFLRPTIGHSPYPTRLRKPKSPSTVFVMLKSQRMLNGLRLNRGTTVEVHEDIAREEIEADRVELAWEEGYQ